MSERTPRALHAQGRIYTLFLLFFFVVAVLVSAEGWPGLPVLQLALVLLLTAMQDRSKGSESPPESFGAPFRLGDLAFRITRLLSGRLVAGLDPQ